MADYSKRTPLNIRGKFYVDLSCICCGICTLIAPLNFLINLYDEYGYVGKQPESKEEIEAAGRAIRNCPVGAIGNDGEELDKITEENYEG